ncbi:MAG: histidinol-phosphate transaminase [Acidimicrobiales bacterium]
MPGQPRDAVVALPAYRPGKAAAQAEAEHGISNAIKLASNETPWDPIPAVQQAIIDAATGTNRYADHRATALRERLAEWLGVKANQVAVGCGSVGLLQQLALAYVDPGDEIVYPWRSFEVYPVYTQLVGAVAKTSPLVDYTFDLAAVLDSVTPRTKLVVLSNPNNPTGTALDMDAIDDLLTKIGHEVIVVLDEAYREFMGEGIADPIPLLTAKHPHLLVLRTFSKAQGLAALRVGYAVGHPDVIETIDKTLFPFAVNGIAQAAAIACIDHMDEVMDRVKEIRAERTRVLAELRQRGYDVPESHANFVFLPLGGATDAVYAELEKEGVVTRPFPGEGIRVTISSPEENDRFLRSL